MTVHTRAPSGCMHKWSMKSNLTVLYIVVIHQGVEHCLLKHNTIVSSSDMHSNHAPHDHCLLPGGTLSPKLHGFMLQQLDSCSLLLTFVYQ